MCYGSGVVVKVADVESTDAKRVYRTSVTCNEILRFPVYWYWYRILGFPVCWHGILDFLLTGMRFLVCNSGTVRELADAESADARRV